MISRVLYGHRSSAAAARSADPGPVLPLSWARTPVATPLLHTTPLPLSRMTWITHADLPAEHNFMQIYRSHLVDQPGGLVLRGCPPELAAWLAERGWATARVGIEARIDLAGPGLQRPAVQKMVRAARRYGSVQEIPWSAAAAERLAMLSRTARPVARPQLRYLFRQAFTPNTRCFAFVGADDQWHGALLISMSQPELAVTELILRAPGAPGGVVESLIAGMGARLFAAGVRWLSLNEVPFHHQSTDLTPIERLINTAGRQLQSVYNASGLLRFKAKFHPLWRPVYLCARPRLPVAALVDLFTVSGCAALWLSQWQRT